MQTTNEKPEQGEEPKQSSQVPSAPSKRAIAKKSTGPVQLEATPDNMIMFALQNNRTMEEIQQLIAMRNAELARIAELEFNEAKADFLKHCPAIIKNKAVPLETNREGKKWGGYTYSDLDNLINTVKESEGNAGLSHDWEDGRNDKGEIVVTCILSHSMGHKKKSTLSWPMDKSGGKNDIQAMKSTISYLRRATLESVLGVSQGGEDNDGKDAPSPSDPFAGDLPALTAEGYRTLLKSVQAGTMTVDQAQKAYYITPEQVDSLRLVEPQKS